MAFPASVFEAYNRFNSLVVGMSDRAAQASGTMAAGPVSASYILGVLDHLRAVKADLTSIAGVGGIAAHAQQQSGEGVDVAAEFAAITAAIDAVGTWIVTNFPKDGDGYLLTQQFGAGGARTERTFSAAQTTTLRGLLDTLAATVE